LNRIGFDGLKLILGKPAFARTFGITLQDPSFAKAFDRVSTLFPPSFPILVHVGDPYYFWETPSNTPVPWTYSSKDPSFEECIALAEQLVKQFPRMVFIFPHLLFLAHQLDRLESILLSRPGVYTDLSPENYFYADLFQQKKRALEFFVSCKDRILFGTDGFFFDPRYKALPYTDLYGNLERTGRLIQFLERSLLFPNPFAPTFARFPLLNGLNLQEHPQGELLLEKLYSANFLSLFGNSPRALHVPSVYTYLKTVLTEEQKNGSCPERRRLIEDTLTKLEEFP
ncbi:MAG: amidohydrolase family protein, partial [Spirochaetales bacterium]|nr:amidohydrolase family protein [Spirochaetales bacterium]